MKKTFTKVFILFFFCLSLSVFAQGTSGKITVSGEVVDATGIPLPGVNVIEKNTTNGVVTDFDGKYEIKVGEESILVFSFVGMKKTEISVKGRSDFNVTLQEDTATLDEVVVVGYGTQKREAVTGSVATVKMSDIEDLPVGNIGSALVGRVLGVGVSGGESRPGTSAQLQLRNPPTGNNIRAKDRLSTAPLYVIDGVVQIDPNTGLSDSTQFDNLDASEVESISFLKDASAAIYGSRAAQGVVLVTTKRGKKGPARFSYSGNFSVSDETYRTKMLNAYDFAKVWNIMNGPNGHDHTYQGSTYNYADPVFSSYFFSENELEHFKTSSYDALDQYWGSAGTQRHNLNVSGGSDDATYFGGISYFTQDGNLGTLNYDRWSFRAGTNMNLGKGFKAGFQVSGYFTDESKTTSKIGSENNENDFRQLQNRAPFLPMYINGFPTVQPGAGANDALVGYHYGEIQRLQNLAESTDNNVTVNLDVEYEVPFIPGLKLKANYVRQAGGARGNQAGTKFSLYDFFGAGQLTADQPQTYVYYESGSGPLGINELKMVTNSDGDIVPAIYLVENGDRLLIDNYSRGSEQIRFQSTYERDFGKHNISALFAIERSERYETQERIIKFGVPEYADGMIWQTTGSFDVNNTYNWRYESGDLGAIGRLNYNYDGKYYAEFLFRSDVSAKFAPENYWGNFYSLSGGWILSREDFFKSNTIDYLKLRASVGSVGKDDTRAWEWRQNFSTQPTGGVVFGGDSNVSAGLSPDRIANPDVRWGRELKTNFGIEARFLDDRLSTTIESFYNMGTELLINLNSGVPFTVGGAAASSNYGKANAWGTELSIGWSDTIGKDFTYATTFNIVSYNSEIVQGNFDNPANWFPWTTNQPGSPDRGTWGYDYLGMFKTQDDIDKYIADSGVTSVFGTPVSELRPGMLYYRDVRGAWDSETRTFAEKDGIIDINDQVQLKKRAKGPQGFSTAIRLGYKGLSLNTVLTVGWGGYNEVGSAKSSFNSNTITGNYENRPAFWANMYDPILNPTGTIPNLSYDNRAINTVSSKYWQVSSFSLLMRNINIGYALPKSITEKVGVNSFRLNLVAMNPFILFNPYKDYGLTPYGSYNNYPVLKTYSLGVNIGF
ncbi:SusC/RagA family TonB-linked outer membrane protein [Aestuariibaculum lutulentum]|uniref:SusC/RagA family TonB-linked outer membrane protein n=1 Tax=Aestuariibaculum lutulentum TaxID=2920935 RepID=A0ABS9RFD7_9FLAO|nr:SusC/RagA family TonB-linked outer membrane protein [Aestuariibaculum lutulentum]MCH4551668.1 SusC/RagA family TonB-linked outer membrane protein [Aestuariibaculum lutulentum]